MGLPKIQLTRYLTCLSCSPRGIFYVYGSKEGDMSDQKRKEPSAGELMRSYDQYFTAQRDAVRGQQDAVSFVIYSAYDYSIPVTYSDSSVPRQPHPHA
jgi:hypothetical protein